VIHKRLASDRYRASSRLDHSIPERNRQIPDEGGNELALSDSHCLFHINSLHRVFLSQ